LWFIFGLILCTITNFQYNSKFISDGVIHSKQISSRSGNQQAILDPNSSTEWSHGNTRMLISWDDVEGALVKINLFRNSVHVVEISGWIDNTGRFSEYVSIEENWGSGDGFTVELEDNLGNIYLSERFRINSNLRVIDSTIGESWATGQERASFDWVGAQGETVKITLYRGNEILSEICSWDVNTGHYELPYPVPANWGQGDGYQIKIEDNLGNIDRSASFSIQPIMVLNPLSGESWIVGESIPEFQWFGAANVVRIELRNSGNAVAEIARWMDDTGSYSPNIQVPSSWAPLRDGTYELVVVDDLGMEGIVSPIYIRHTDDTIDGAIPLTRMGNNSISSPSDVDYWVVDTSRGNKYKVTASDTTTVTLQVLSSSGGTEITDVMVGFVDWQAARSGNYIVRVASKLGATGSYTLNFGRTFGSIGRN